MTEAKSNGWIKVLVFLLILGIAIFIIWRVLQPKNTTETASSSDGAITSMTCTAGDIDNGVFETYDAATVTYTINLLFEDDSLSSLTYNYDGTYASSDAAKTAGLAINADFDQALQDLGYTATYFSGTNHSVVDNQAILTFSADVEDLNMNLTKFVMLDTDESGDFPTEHADVRQNYVSHSFVCSDVVTSE